MTVIDLGDVSDPSAMPEEYPPARRREFDRAALRRLAPAVLAGICALLLGGSAVPGPPVLHEVWSVPFPDSNTMSMDRDTVYVGRPVEGGSEVTAYDLENGAVRWKRTGDGTPPWFDNPAAAGVLLLPGEVRSVEVKLDDGSLMPFDYAGSTTALDPATGRTLWKQPGLQVYGDTGATVLLSERASDGMVTSLRLVNVRDGSVVWDRRLPAGVDVTQIQADSGIAARVVTAGPGGEVTTLRYSDGTPLSTARVLWTPTSPSTGAGSMITTATGLVMVLDLEENQGRMATYRADTLELLWTRDFTDWANVRDCGPGICIGNGNNFSVVDPITGAALWNGDGNPFNGVTLDDGRLLLTSDDSGLTQRVVDAATGQPTGITGSGQVLFRDHETGVLTLTRELFPDLTRMAVSRLDPSTGRSVTVGVLPLGEQRLSGGVGRRLLYQRGDRLTVIAVG